MKVKNTGKDRVLIGYDYKQLGLGNSPKIYIKPGETINVDLSEDKIKKFDNIEILTKKITATVKKAKNKWQ